MSTKPIIDFFKVQDIMLLNLDMATMFSNSSDYHFVNVVPGAFTIIPLF